jgi:hypothetical protein
MSLPTNANIATCSGDVAFGDGTLRQIRQTTTKSIEYVLVKSDESKHGICEIEYQPS